LLSFLVISYAGGKPHTVTTPEEITFYNGDLIVTIPRNGRVPWYSLSRSTSNETYFFDFRKFYEIKPYQINKKTVWVKVPFSEIDLSNLRWAVTSTNTSFTYKATGRLPIFDRFSSIQLVNNFQSGVTNGICSSTVQQNCVNQCDAGCGDVGACQFGCQIGGINNADTCSSSCSGLGDTCLAPCLQTVDCINRGCSTYVKFDIILQNYKWISKDKNARLIFKYGVKGKNTARPSVTDNTLTFGDFFVQYNTTTYVLPKTCTACDNKNCKCTKKVITTVDTTISKQGYANVQFNFNKFDNQKTLINDPAIGIAHSEYISPINPVVPDIDDTTGVDIPDVPEETSSSSAISFSFVILSLLLSAFFF